MRKFSLALAALALFAVGAQACNPLVVSVATYSYAQPLILLPSIAVTPVFVQPQIQVQAVCPQVAVPQIQVQAAQVAVAQPQVVYPQVQVQAAAVSYGQSFVTAPLVQSFAYPMFAQQVAVVHQHAYANVAAVNVVRANAVAVNARSNAVAVSAVRSNGVRSSAVAVSAVNSGGSQVVRVRQGGLAGLLFGNKTVVRQR